MKIKYLLFLSLLLSSICTFGQTKSLREILAVADVIATTEKIADPFYPNQKKVAFSDHQTMIALDSVKVVSFIKKGRNELKPKSLFINSTTTNAFYDVFTRPVGVPPMDMYAKQPTKQTLLFAKTHKDYTEVLYFIEMDESLIPNVQQFISWADSVQKQKSETVKCRLYIEKYLSMLESNEVAPFFNYFDNILLPQSDFMIYYKTKVPDATLLTIEQKERLKNYLFDNDYFGDIENAKLAYEFFPEETLKFYEEKLSDIRT